MSVNFLSANAVLGSKILRGYMNKGTEMHDCKQKLRESQCISELEPHTKMYSFWDIFVLIFLLVCSAGFMRDADTDNCTICPRGTYNEEVDATSCTSCPDGLTTESAGTYNASYCLGKKNTI